VDTISNISSFLWSDWVPWVLLAAGILFTIWTKFTQYTAMTHGVMVVRGVYDDPDDPGAINHFQALAAALSATVGLGNIGGVALAIGAGGPGALFWMWITGIFGMALKTIEITLAMMYRNVDDPENPHGGAMWVVERVLGDKGGIWKPIARMIGTFFCLTLIVSTFTGGNMFQAWNVANLTHGYFDVPTLVTGIILASVVGLVIIGGIKRIGSVAGKLVPFMVLIYLVSAFAVLAGHITEIPGMLMMVVNSAFEPSEATGAFLGGTMGWAFIQGMKRALFSNEAGQGSAPIAHAAAKTNESAREGIVGGIGPFIDTLCICTLTALVILVTGTWNRAAISDDNQQVVPFSAPIELEQIHRVETSVDGWSAGEALNVVLDAQFSPLQILRGGQILEGVPAEAAAAFDAALAEYRASPSIRYRAVTSGGIEALPPSRWDEAWSDDDQFFLIARVEGAEDGERGSALVKLLGTVKERRVPGSDAPPTLEIDWNELEFGSSWQGGVAGVSLVDQGVYHEFRGAQLTGHAFDREFFGLGKYLVTFAAWLFAISTMISWSYYGEQGMVYMTGARGVLPYKLVFLALVIYAAKWIETTDDMEVFMDLGTGAMLWANLPIVIGLGFLATRELSRYGRDLKAGKCPRHDRPKLTDVIDGKDVEK